MLNEQGIRMLLEEDVRGASRGECPVKHRERSTIRIQLVE